MAPNTAAVQWRSQLLGAWEDSPAFFDNDACADQAQMVQAIMQQAAAELTPRAVNTPPAPLQPPPPAFAPAVAPAPFYGAGYHPAATAPAFPSPTAGLEERQRERVLLEQAELIEQQKEVMRLMREREREKRHAEEKAAIVAAWEKKEREQQASLASMTW